MTSKRCIAMLLAGGQGSRLGILTRSMAKPAVPFGGKYRIIDFPLSNCTHSDIDTVGVLTQYQPLELNAYIGNGAPWDLDRTNGGVYVLPPYMDVRGGEWYKGTANAIFQNMVFIEKYNPEYVLILSGDHIYKMNYARMLGFHIQKEADATISVMEVPWEEADRFGIMDTDEEMRITQFSEKPKKPKSNKASMGIYIFTWKRLREQLLADAADPNSESDFGKNIIPSMLKAHMNLYAFPFKGYWKDVGTLDSLWEANMDLLEATPAFNLYENEWRIYSRNPALPPHFVAEGGEVSNALVTEGCVVQGAVKHSVLFAGVTIERGAVVEDSVIMPGVVVKAGAHVKRAIVAENAIIGPGAQVGTDGEICVVGESVQLPAGFIVNPGEQIDHAELKKRLEPVEEKPAKVEKEKATKSGKASKEESAHANQ